MVVLINGGSASASEISLAPSVNGIAKLVGKKFRQGLCARGFVEITPDLAQSNYRALASPKENQFLKMGWAF